MTTTTLKKISQVLNLSISTVSRALKNHPDISDRTKQKVIELANTLDYEPNANAINLRTSKSKVFGLIVPQISNYFYDSFISAVEEDSRLHGYTLMILQSGDNPAIELENIKLCRQNRVMGLFICITPQTTDMNPFLRFSEFNTPVIFFDKVPSDIACNKVCLADSDAAMIAADKLIQQQKKNILAIFGNKELSITQRRENAFISAYNQSEFKASITSRYAHSSDQAKLITHEFLTGPSKPDGIFCMSDEILTGVMKTIQELHLKIPDEISLISMSNGFFPKLFSPEITYVETNGYKLGKLAFGRMLSYLSGNTSVQELTLGSILVEGGSL